MQFKKPYPDLRAFIQRLEDEGLAPSPEADRRTLLRRLSLDLTGLAPTLEEVEAFVQDEGPDAYEKVVDRLLASPQFGEHQAQGWLDIARYADSQGFEKDQPRTMWRYREWVIDAFNADMPFDIFTGDQIAGDLNEKPSFEQLVATGFHRNTQTNTEGGTDNEEFRSAAVIDRVNTTMQAWMGLTAGCTQCHSHKFDPISHEEYYSLYAFFNQTQDADLDDDSPFISAPSPEQAAEVERLDEAYEALETRLTEGEDVLDAVAEWLEQTDHPTKWKTSEPFALKAESGATLTAEENGLIVAAGEVPQTDTYTIKVDCDLATVTALKLEVIKRPDQPGPGRTAHGNFVLNELEIRLTPNGEALPLRSASATFEQVDYPIAAAIDKNAAGNSGWAISPAYDRDHTAVFRLGEPLKGQKGLPLHVTLRQTHGTMHVLQRFRLSLTGDPFPILPPSEEIQALLAIPFEQLDIDQRRALARHVLKVSESLAPLHEEIEAVADERSSLAMARPTALVMKALPQDQHRETRLFLGGNFLTPDTELGTLEPNVPAALHPFPMDAPRDRRGLTTWLLHEDNPLTARVQVNRTWEQCFGNGLVQTTDDFGVQGTRPTHPKLLDWLALHWQKDLAWSQKSLLRLLVTSSTYRQSSANSPELLERDPRNTLLARASRLRLSAEQLRDQTLRVAGLLQLHPLGGPSVTPYLPDGMLPQAFDSYIQPVSTGADLHRRGIYTLWRRTGHYPTFATFDAPSRETCTITRERSNTPLQALVLLNDTVFVEAAQALARRAIEEAGEDPADRLSHAFRLALARSPKSDELKVLQGVYDRAEADYAADPKAAQEMATMPLGPLAEGMPLTEAAALTVASNVILNLDEFITRP